MLLLKDALLGMKIAARVDNQIIENEKWIFWLDEMIIPMLLMKIKKEFLGLVRFMIFLKRFLMKLLKY